MSDEDYPPIIDDDAAIAKALRDVSIPTLMLSMVHMTGDMRWVRGPIRPGPPGLNGVQGDLSEADQATFGRQRSSRSSEYRDAGSTPPAASVTSRRRARDDVVLVGSAGRGRPRRDDLRGRAAAPPRPGRARARVDARGPGGSFRVCVIGCGESGLLAGIRLVARRHPVHDPREERGRRRHLVREPLSRRARRHREPLLLVLVRARAWSHFYARAARAARVPRRGHGPARHRAERALRLHGASRPRGTTDARPGHVAYTDPDGAAVTLDGECGDLRGRPAQPAVDPGAPRRRGLRRAVVPQRALGPGRRSRRQGRRDDRRRRERLPDRAGDRGHGCGRSRVFQRTAQWIAPNPLYYQPVGDGVAWALEHLPYYDRWYRTLVAYRGDRRCGAPRPGSIPTGTVGTSRSARSTC